MLGLTVVFYDYCMKGTQTYCLKIMQAYFLTIPRVRGLKWVFQSKIDVFGVCLPSGLSRE